MNFEQLHIKNHYDLQKFQPVNLSRNLIVELESNNTNLQVNQLFTSPTQNVFIWITVLGMMSWLLLEVIRELGTIKIAGGVMFSFTPNKCRSCRFYAKNLYLKCAVHPSIVLTKKARNCLDYCNKNP